MCLQICNKINNVCCILLFKIINEKENLFEKIFEYQKKTYKMSIFFIKSHKIWLYR